MKKLLALLPLLVLSLSAGAQGKGPDYFHSVDETVGKVVRFYHQANLLKSVGPYLFYKDAGAYKPYKDKRTYTDLLGGNMLVVEIIPGAKGKYLVLRPDEKNYDGPDYYLYTKEFDPSKHMRNVSYWRELLKRLPAKYPYANASGEKYAKNKAPRIAGKYLEVKWKSYSVPDDYFAPVMYNYEAGGQKYSCEYRFLFRDNLPSSDFLTAEEFAAAEAAFNAQQ